LPQGPANFAHRDLFTSPIGFALRSTYPAGNVAILYARAAQTQGEFRHLGALASGGFGVHTPVRKVE